MNQLVTEDVVRERYNAMLADADAERRATLQVELNRAWRRVEKARARLDRALEEAFALPARPNPVTDPDASADANEHEREKQPV